MRKASWLKAKKQMCKEKRREQRERMLAEAAPKAEPLGADAAGIVPPDTRFTEEYQQFLMRQETAVTQSDEVN